MSQQKTAVQTIAAMLRSQNQRVRSQEISLLWWSRLAAALKQILGPGEDRRFFFRARETARQLAASRDRLIEVEDMQRSVSDDEALAREVLIVDRMRYGRTNAMITDQRGKYGTGLAMHIAEEGRRLAKRDAQRRWRKRYPLKDFKLPEVEDPMRIIADALVDMHTERTRLKEELAATPQKQRRLVIKDLLRVEADMAALGFRVADPSPALPRAGRPPKAEVEKRKAWLRRKRI